MHSSDMTADISDICVKGDAAEGLTWSHTHTHRHTWRERNIERTMTMCKPINGILHEAKTHINLGLLDFRTIWTLICDV